MNAEERRALNKARQRDRADKVKQRRSTTEDRREVVRGRKHGRLEGQAVGQLRRLGWRDIFGSR